MANRNDYATKSKKKFFDRNEKEIDECEDLMNSINKQMNDKKENILLIYVLFVGKNQYGKEKN